MTTIEACMAAVLFVCILISIFNPYRRDEEVNRRITRYRHIRKIKSDAGLPRTFEDAAISRLGDN